MNTSATITKTARILALPSKHRPAEFPVRLRVGSCLAHDLADSTIATIGPLDPDFAQEPFATFGSPTILFHAGLFCLKEFVP